LVAIGSCSVIITLVRVEVLRKMRLRRVVVHEPLMASVGVVPYDWDRAGFSAALGNVAEQVAFGPGVFSL
jgi:hypothetical protein